MPRGGKRAGAGRPPKVPISQQHAPGQFSAAGVASGIARQPHLSLVTYALGLYARGFAFPYIAEKTGRTVATLTGWPSRYHTILADIRKSLITSAHSAFDPLAEEALGAFAAALHSERVSDRLRAAEHISSRVWGPPSNAAQQAPEQVWSITYVDASTHQTYVATAQGMQERAYPVIDAELPALQEHANGD